MKNYTVEIQKYNEPGVVEANCNEISFINTGDSIAEINGFSMSTGESLSISGNQDEQDVSNYILSFSGSGESSLTTIRKIYRV